MGSPPADRGARPPATPLVIPRGEPADGATVAAVTRTVREYYACVNADDLPRQFALFTDAGLRRYGLRFGLPIGADLPSATPQPLAPDERFFPRTIRDVQFLPDGRVAAVVVESNLPLEAQGTFDDAFVGGMIFLFVQQGDRYLIDDNVSPIHAESTPVP